MTMFGKKPSTDVALLSEGRAGTPSTSKDMIVYTDQSSTEAGDGRDVMRVAGSEAGIVGGFGFGAARIQDAVTKAKRIRYSGLYRSEIRYARLQSRSDTIDREISQRH